MAKLLDSSRRAREYFGSFIFQKRRALEIGTYGMAPVLGVSHATIYCWERGRTFPRSIGVLQRMELVYGGISDFLRDLLEGELLLSDRERQEFMEEVEALRGREPLERGFIPYPHYKEERRSHWAMMFARYFNERRREEGIQRASMARLLGVRYHALVNWERGTLPRDVVMYQKLDLMCPDLLKVLFGQCLRHPILLTREEREEVLETFDRELTIRRNRPLSGPLPKPRREL